MITLLEVGIVDSVIEANDEFIPIGIEAIKTFFVRKLAKRSA